MKQEFDLEELLPQEGIDALYAAFKPNDLNLHQTIINVLLPYEESFKAKGIAIDNFANAIEDNLTWDIEPEYKPGMRVVVTDGFQKNLLGEGTYEGRVKVYCFIMPDGSLESLENAEEEPPPEMVPEGAEVYCTEDNPKIRLDSGKVVYGCQCYWRPIE